MHPSIHDSFYETNSQNLYVFSRIMQYITRQLETVRDSSESRMRIYEELDRTSQDLEKTNQRLHIDAKTDKQRIEKSVHRGAM